MSTTTTPGIDLDNQRELFEAGERDSSSNLERRPDGQYENPCTQSAWEGWQNCLIAHVREDRRASASQISKDAAGEPVAAQFKMPGETWEECSVDEEEVMLRHGYKFRYLYAAPVHAAADEDPRVTAFYKLRDIAERDQDAESANIIQGAIGDLHESRVSAGAAAKTDHAPCKKCAGTGVVDDGEIDCYPNGAPYENGPVNCVTDCPCCGGSGQASAAGAGSEQACMSDMPIRPAQVMKILQSAHGRPVLAESALKIKTWRERAYEALGDHWRGYKPDSYMESEIDDLRAALAKQSGAHAAADDAKDAANDALDAARYCWIRSHDASLETQQQDKGIINGPSCYHEVEGIRELKWGVALDTAVDAAMAAAQREAS